MPKYEDVENERECWVNLSDLRDHERGALLSRIDGYRGAARRRQASEERAAAAEAKRQTGAGAEQSGEAEAEKFFARDRRSHSYDLDSYRAPSQTPESRTPRGGPGQSGWL